MSNIVKLILVCQIKDVCIPQLMPLSWVISNFILLVVLLVISMIYRISYYIFNKNFLGFNKTNFIIWCW